MGLLTRLSSYSDASARDQDSPPRAPRISLLSLITPVLLLSLYSWRLERVFNMELARNAALSMSI